MHTAFALSALAFLAFVLFQLVRVAVGLSALSARLRANLDGVRR